MDTNDKKNNSIALRANKIVFFVAGFGVARQTRETICACSAP
jgi:hypothetical protein